MADLGLADKEEQISDVLGTGIEVQQSEGAVSFTLAPRSVLVLKVIDPSVSAQAPEVSATIPEHVTVGKPENFSAEAAADGIPVLEYHWEFGDGTNLSGREVRHTYTRRGNFTVKLTGEGIDGVPFEKTVQVEASGRFDTRFDPARFVRRTETKR
jgi:PKD repeat protein